MVRQGNKTLNRLLKSFRFQFVVTIIFVSAGYLLCFAESGVYDFKVEKTVIQGRKYLENEEYGKAIALFKQELKNHPENPDLNYCLGFVYYKSGDLAKAQKGFKKTIKLDEKYAEAYYFLAIIADKMNDKEDVIMYLNKVIYLNPQFQSAYYNKGVVFLSLNDPERAIKDFAYALYLSPKDHSSVIGILKAYDMMNMMDTVTMIKTDKKQKRENLTERAEAPVNLEPDRYVHEVQKEDSPHSIIKEKKDFEKLEGSDITETYKEEDKPVETEKGKGNLEGFDTIDEIEQNMKITVYSPEGWEKTVLLNTQLINLASYKDKSGIVEINFSKPENLRNKCLYFDVKGLKGGEELRGVIKDNSTKRSPEFAVYNIYDEWKTKVINIEDNSQGFLDEEKIIQIKLKLLTEEKNRAKVSIRNIRIDTP